VPRTAAWTPQSSTCDTQRAGRGQQLGRSNQIPAKHNAARATGNGLSTTIKYLRGAAGIGLGTTIMHLRRKRGNGLVTTIEYLRRTMGGAADSSPGTTIKYLRHKTSGAAGNGESRYRGLFMCPFTTSAPHSPFFFAWIRYQQAN
jgi:hypothetical protein